jgi:predicted alpha/beta superfamily hydrolase
LSELKFSGADHFKNFIDKELLQKIEKEYKIDTRKIVLCGHFLGGYFIFAK